ncbi:MAG: cytochrome c3 family protein [Planctomycetota bacterium]|jgi:hypothetical protein
MSNKAKQRSGCSVAKMLLTCVVLLASGCEPGAKPVAGGETETISEPETASPISAGAVDNSECLVCHMDFKRELISARHAREGVGCGFCHGPSLAHGDDEMNITPPDRLFGRAEIAEFCQDCHPTHKTGKVYDAYVRKWHSKRRPNGRMILDDSVCTDCHGKHAILRPDQQL